MRLLLLAVCAVVLPASADEHVGPRPYEMDWAGRSEDLHPPLVDFENLDGWTVECRQSEASFVRSREQQLWDRHVGKLAYRGTGNQPLVSVRPPCPLPIPQPMDCVNVWVYGNTLGADRDATTPPVNLSLVLRGSDANPMRVLLTAVRWKEWWVVHHKFSPQELTLLGDGAAVEALEIAGGKNTDERVLYFDDLAFYKESLPPLSFQPRPKRNIELPASQSPGANTGPALLPFPTREQTILPDNPSGQFKVTLEQSDGAWMFHYRGGDGHLVYGYKPATGTLGDMTAQWEGRTGVLRPMQDGGIYLAGKDGVTPVPPEKAELKSCRAAEDTLVSVWRCEAAGQTAEVSYTFRLWQKSLVIDVRCLGGQVAEVQFGKAVGADRPRLVTVPFLACDAQRPAVLVMGPPESPCFLMGLVDHCRSNASALWGANKVAATDAIYNGGSRYAPKTDGRRNDCYERLFLTVSPRFEEVLPNVPNPQSPWMHVTAERVWRAHGAGNRQSDYAQWKKVARYGMSKILITDHETGWRDGEESFTLRTRAAPGKGGDEGQAEYGHNIHRLGFRYGIYNNYTDFAPVNEHWNEDYVTRLSDGNWRTAWRRCYNLKPSRAVELEARLSPLIQEKFQLDTAYCDVHTAVTPWRYCDFDARVPGAGTFAAVFYAYGEIMLHQKKTWNGPVYSEGNNHWYYCGLTDGNYGQDQLARLAENPWLVDFDLRKLHPLCCNFGMGNPGMLYGKQEALGKTKQEQQQRLDRFLAATLAFGHTGFLVLEGGMSTAARSYFAVQQAHARYALDTVAEVHYADAAGSLHDTSAAVANEAFRRSQVVILYHKGMEVTVNGHPTDTWQTPHGLLPPNGWYVTDTAKGDLVAWSMLTEGHRADYVDSPAYLYADGRGQLTHFARAACDGQMVVLRRDDGTLELIPITACSTMAVSLGNGSATAEALDEEGKSLGPATTRFSDGLVHVMPVAGAFSYVLHAAPVASLRSG